MTFLIVMKNVQNCDDNIIHETFVEINTATYGIAW